MGDRSPPRSQLEEEEDGFEVLAEAEVAEAILAEVDAVLVSVISSW